MDFLHHVFTEALHFLLNLKMRLGHHCFASDFLFADFAEDELSTCHAAPELIESAD
jgi:hypothetical protein